MKFMDLFDIEPTVRVCDIIILFLIGVMIRYILILPIRMKMITY